MGKYQVSTRLIPFLIDNINTYRFRLFIKYIAVYIYQNFRKVNKPKGKYQEYLPTHGYPTAYQLYMDCIVKSYK